MNLIVIDKQPQLQYLDIEAAAEHCRRGASVWDWASNENSDDSPDIVLACAGDVVTMETLAAAQLLRDWLPDMLVRVVNVVDLMKLCSPGQHPHGMDESSFNAMFGTDTDVVFAFHGYPQALHQILHGRTHPSRFHVRGFEEQGTTTTPFDMVVLNGVSRFHLAAEAVRRSRRIPRGAETLTAHCDEMLKQHGRYIVEHFEDMPEINNWTWSNAST